MRFLIVLVSVVLAINASTDTELWQDFKQKYGRDYRNLREEQTRFSIFKDNVATIQEHNDKYANGEVSYYMGVNQFADMTPEEFRAMLNRSAALKPVRQQPSVWHQMSGVQAASSVNWLEKGVVTPIKDQGDCGSCWAFAAIAALEGAYALKTGSLVSFSEQNLIDCSSANGGCDGGWMQAAFEYIRDNGIETESDYPYQAVDGQCQFSSGKSVTTVSSYVNLPKTEASLQDAVASVGPVSVAVDADYFQYYAGGVFDQSECGSADDDLNHEVLVVGYGTESSQDYWLVKNSWGSEWGESGYIKMIRNKNNQCGIAQDAAYPIV